MRTYGRHENLHRPQQYEARCEICGVVWRRSELHEDGVGRLICPDEGDGLDEFTLAEESAEDLRQFLNRERVQENRGIPSPPGEFYTSPLSIEGQDVVGWWAPDIGLRSATVDVRWRNAASAGVDGDLYTLGTLPTPVTDGLTFAGGDALGSSFGELFRAGDDVTLWMVANLTEETDTSQEMLAVTTGGDSSAALAGVALGRYRSDTNGGKVYGWVKWSAADPGQVLLGTRPADGTHIYRLTATSSLVTLAIDDDEFVVVPSSDTGLQVPLGVARMGFQAYGTYYEGVAHR